ncbi:MAG: hypothetical protein ACI4XL_10145 [Bacillus sp. (in: firmicutes)]
MKSLQDALYNWLSIKVVSDARPDDKAAKETTNMFRDILHQDHHISDIQIEKQEDMYRLAYIQSGEAGKARFPVDLIDCMLDSINEHPERYKNYN